MHHQPAWELLHPEFKQLHGVRCGDVHAWNRVFRVPGVWGEHIQQHFWGECVLWLSSRHHKCAGDHWMRVCEWLLRCVCSQRNLQLYPLHHLQLLPHECFHPHPQPCRHRCRHHGSLRVHHLHTGRVLPGQRLRSVSVPKRNLFCSYWRNSAHHLRQLLSWQLYDRHRGCLLCCLCCGQVSSNRGGHLL